MLNQVTKFIGGDRYKFDFVLCTTEEGFAQVDTRNDASYYGNWVNPSLRRVITFAEGDYIETTYSDDAEMVAWFTRVFTSEDSEFTGIDAGFNRELRDLIVAHGLGPFLHGAARLAGVTAP